MTPRYGTPPLASQRYTRRPGAYVILPRGGALLLTRQDAERPEIQLPGGGIDPGEHPIQALHREVFEETGWHIGQPRKLGVFRRFVFMPEYDLHAEKLCHIYLARPIRAHSAPTEIGHEALWMSPELAITTLDNPGDRAFVAKWWHSISD